MVFAGRQMISGQVYYSRAGFPIVLMAVLGTHSDCLETYLIGLRPLQ
jgi:hypothetical protein